MRIFYNHVVAAALFFFLSPLPASAAESLQLYAAGSLKEALGEVAVAYENTYKTKVATKFGPSGLLTTAIEGGENPDVFASANMAHPEKLAASGWGGPVVLFARNQLCALAQADIAATTDNLLPTLLDNNVRLGTSTPKADPSGDYAWELFNKAEAVQKGSYAALSGKALQLTGGPASDKAPEGRNQYGWVMEGEKSRRFSDLLHQRRVGSKTSAVAEDRHHPREPFRRGRLRPCRQERSLAGGMAAGHVYSVSRGTKDSAEIRF